MMKIDINDEHLNELEAEAIFVMREVAAQFEKKVLLFSGEKIQLYSFIWQEKHSGLQRSLSA